jgi:alkylated DNA repair dioxygenase AlkB
MATLFQEDAVQPVPGFTYTQGFISPDEEKQLVDLVHTLELKPFMFQGFEAKRKTASFGYDYHFGGRKLEKGKEIPPEFGFLIEKVAKQLSMKAEDFREVLVTEYPAGAVINWHRDAPPFDIIAGVSLLTGCVFRLRPYDKEKRVRGSLVSVPVGRRSLYVISGESRENWQHSILPVADTRFSITLRTLKASD